LAEEQHNLGKAWPYAIDSGPALKKAFRAASAWVEVHSEAINTLNVFPVPDGDTGTNMLLTCQAACDELSGAGESIPEVMRAIAHGSLMGARGNSGVILSQILRGMARSIDNKERITPADMAAALREGSITAYKGVIRPVEGTILTVIRETADAATACAEQSDDMAVFFDTIVSAAQASVERTPSLLLTLRLAGVVDAGGQGLFILLQGLHRFIRGESNIGINVFPAQVPRTEAPEEGYGYDIQFVLHGEQLNVEAIRSHIDAMGESTLVVGDEHMVKVHVHAPNPGPVLEYGATVGAMSRIIVENMQQQFEEFRDTGHSSKTGSPLRPTEDLLANQSTNTAQLTGISTVVVVSGSGFETVFKSLDVSAIVQGGQTMNPSIQEILAAIEAVATSEVIVLPNNKNIVLTAEAASKLSSKSVGVVPTKTIPQGIAALLALNAEADLKTNCQSMELAAAQVSTAEITIAVRDSHFDGIDVQKGQIIGIVDDRLVATGADIQDVVLAALADLKAGTCELLTFYHGNGTKPGDAQALVERVHQLYPQVETELVEGGQPHYMYIISAE
jgi:DAK2 domain fusion protein YloV